MTSEFEAYGGLHLPMHQPTPMKDCVCPKCGHEVVAKDKPEPIRWTDGHTCRFIETAFEHTPMKQHPTKKEPNQ